MENVLRQYKDLQNEKRDLEQRIKKIQEELREIEQKNTVYEKVSGGAGGKQHFHTEGILSQNYKSKKNQLLIRKIRLKALNGQIESMLVETERYINTIADSRKRQILRYKYIDGLSWRHIAKKMGPGNSEDAIRMEIKRFLKSQESGVQ